MAARVMSLQMGPYLAEADVQLVATTLLKEIGRIEAQAAAADISTRGGPMSARSKSGSLNPWRMPARGAAPAHSNLKGNEPCARLPI
jgi:hypothetical protein